MLEWLFEWLFKPYIDKLVDQRIKENMFERYWQQKNEETRQRINRLRRSLDPSTQDAQAETSEELLSSSGIQKGREEPRVQVTSDKATIKKNKELSAMKAKLMRKK
tara:strand:- start:4058 stop:4375 length:318 start_codon:yes stop_codon:yes gene_type:complete